MIRPRASLLALLLAFAPAVWADTVNVTTLVDEDNVLYPGTPDTGCSLREAVGYITQPSTSTRQSYGGCVAASTSSADVINVPQAQTINPSATAFQLTLGPITLLTSATISSTSTTTATYPVIIAKPGSRLFIVTHDPTKTVSPSQLQLSELTLQGGLPLTLQSNGQPAQPTQAQLAQACSGTQSCPDRGGLIYVSDTLLLTNVFASQSIASVAGGAIYVDIGGSLTTTTSQFNNNYAPTGAAVAMATKSTLTATTTANLTSTLFTANHAINPDGSDNASGYIIDLGSALTSGTITASTIGENFGIAVRGQSGLTINNATIVDNSGGGVDFNQSQTVALYNSIVAGNPNNQINTSAGNPNDCLNPPATQPSTAVVKYDLFSGVGGACAAFNDASNQTISNTNSPTTSPQDQLLIAGSTSTTSASGVTTIVCNLPDSPGLLCPLNNNGGNTNTYLPRLPVVASMDLSSNYGLNLIVNRGSPLTGASACVAADQRTKSERANTCDIGAIAVQAASPVAVSFTTLLGQPVSGAFESDLGDVPLLPADACPQIASTSTMPGCISSPMNTPKGIMEFNAATHEIYYAPSSYFYGTDQFTVYAATTLSRFTDASASPMARYVPVNVTITTQPATGASSKSTKGGALSLWQVIMLAGFIALASERRRRVRS